MRGARGFLDDLTPETLAVLGVLGLAVYIYMKGGVSNAAASAGEAIVNAAGNAVTGAVRGGMTGASKIIGIPTPDEITTDPTVARYIIDYPQTGGYLAASEWASAMALWAAQSMPEGSGTPPPMDSPVGRAFPPIFDANTGNISGSW